jgi:hypothetical protein
VVLGLSEPALKSAGGKQLSATSQVDQIEHNQSCNR